jgi:hypothetical protein
MRAEGLGDGVAVPVAVDGLDGAAQLAGLGEHLQRDRGDLAVGGLGVDPDAVQSHVSRVS